MRVFLVFLLFRPFKHVYLLRTKTNGGASKSRAPPHATHRMGCKVAVGGKGARGRGERARSGGSRSQCLGTHNRGIQPPPLASPPWHCPQRPVPKNARDPTPLLHKVCLLPWDPTALLQTGQTSHGILQHFGKKYTFLHGILSPCNKTNAF